MTRIEKQNNYKQHSPPSPFTATLPFSRQRNTYPLCRFRGEGPSEMKNRARRFFLLPDANRASRSTADDVLPGTATLGIAVILGVCLLMKERKDFRYRIRASGGRAVRLPVSPRQDNRVRRRSAHRTRDGISSPGILRVCRPDNEPSSGRRQWPRVPG